MKHLIQGIMIMAIAMMACHGNKPSESQTNSNNVQTLSEAGNIPSSDSSVADKKNTVSVKEIVNPYLQLKNALVKDNSSDAAILGGVLEEAFKKFDKTILTPDQQKIFGNVAEDATEHAEHISQSGGNIEHQREHFELLSKDMYDLAKAFYAGQVLYKEFCPIYNKGKGAFWLSESKVIQNPYFGKEMLTCGSVMEELN